MKLEEGMYVRTKHNGICKLYREFYEDSVDVGIGVFPEIEGFFIDEKEINYIEKRDILKASYNIIDLIEVGDYVNGHKVCDDFRLDTDDYGNNFIEIGIESDKFLNHYIREDEIETIVTKEQFESMSYRVGSEE